MKKIEKHKSCLKRKRKENYDVDILEFMILFVINKRSIDVY